ncbi:hypothetical protein ACFQJ8_04070 [Halocatena marina]|uniref:hypothetical protein n=1 Tax=Halocatena marina TaxID=2934937 RepID=UPI00360CB117
MTDALLGSAGKHEQEPLETTARAAAMRPSFSLASSTSHQQTRRDEEIDRHYCVSRSGRPDSSTGGEQTHSTRNELEFHKG